MGTSFVCDPYLPIPDRPGFNERFSLLETCQVICGRGDLAQLRKIAPNFPKLAPTYVTYGPRAAWQLRAIYERLRTDPLSRQAVMTIYQTEDFHKGYPDCPCTMSLQFLVREDELHLITTMRSNDIWLGTPTDVYMFTFLQREMASALGIRAGSYTHQVGSLHVYERHWAQLSQVGRRETARRESAGFFGWDGVRVGAEALLDWDLGETDPPNVLPWVSWLDAGV